MPAMLSMRGTLHEACHAARRLYRRTLGASEKSWRNRSSGNREVLQVGREQANRSVARMLRADAEMSSRCCTLVGFRLVCHCPQRSHFGSRAIPVQVNIVAVLIHLFRSSFCGLLFLVSTLVCFSPFSVSWPHVSFARLSMHHTNPYQSRPYHSLLQILVLLTG